MKHLKYVFAIIALLAAILACDLPTESATETATPDETEVVTETEALPEETGTEEPVTEEPATEEPATEEPFTCGAGMISGLAFSVEFCYPTAVASGFTQTMIPELLPTPDGMPWEFNPDTIEITLTDYPIDNMYHGPTVLIYPVDDFIALGSNIETIVTNLETLLAGQPANPNVIPFLPTYNAAQMMQAKVSYLDFRNGSGVRFITQYSQAAVPISNDASIYSYMGLTDDGQYFIAATFPVTHDLFYPDALTEPAEGWQTFAANFEDYISIMEADLALESDDSFTPALSNFDSMMASFFIPPDAIP